MKTLTIILTVNILISCSSPRQRTSNYNEESRFFTSEEFKNNFGKELLSSQDVYDNMRKNGLKEYQYCRFDFDYVSDTKEKLDSLRKFLIENYGYEMKDIKKDDGLWNLWGDATKFPVDSENLLYWALDLYVKGYQFDCELRGYGVVVDTPEFPDFDTSKADYYFNKAIESYNNQNLGLAIIHWSTSLRINPDDPNSYYSRAIAKNELYTWKAALRDYDKAIELAPNFIDALINRGTARDESGDYIGAIEDYNKAIELDSNNAMAYFNRGNTKFNLENKNGACDDWIKSKSLGADYADERINKYCK